ncbi:hypothetical protein [Wolbachia endosymbiont of Psylliodes chrysocephala]|uniref:hypothetical protein n=1 Tax=Wolbachia endosymbiont of Psylliodes chrysocephala TaxID=2883236 RepID=UPI00209D05F1|nr:hypothetical protein [Wolbachia endosymbiont of Psylliodes chrysocephala]
MWSRVHRSQCLGLPSWNDKKKRYWYDIKREELMAKRNTGVIQHLFLSFQCLTLESRN